MIDRNGRPERPIITFQCREGQRRGGQGSSKHAVVAHWTRLSQNGLGGERAGKGNERATVQKTTAVMKQTSQFAGTGLDKNILSRLPEIQTIKDKLRLPCSVSPVDCDMPTAAEVSSM